MSDRSRTALRGEPPADPLLIREGRELLCYLQSIAGRKMLSGQQETPRCTACEEARMQAITGSLPALRGMDVDESAVDPIPETVRSWRQQNQVTSYTWHIGAPPSDDNARNARRRADVDQALKPGTPENEAYTAKLDRMADRLLSLQRAGVPVLWRPFHEMNGGFFWWSDSGPEAYKRLWVQMFDYFTATRHVHNLIWVWSTAGSKPPDADWYPGDRYVDIVGSDTYSPFSTETTWSKNELQLATVAPDKPTAITETDRMPDLRRAIRAHLHAVWFLCWDSPWVDENTSAWKRTVYGAENVITADEMPNLS